MGKKLKCSANDNDFILVGDVDIDDDIEIMCVVNGKYSEIFLSPQNAIQLIKDIKQAYADADINLEEIEA